MSRSAFVSITTLLTFVTVVLSSLTPASASGPGRAPWVVASSPTSITLDWPGGSSGYRTFYASSYSAVAQPKARSKTSTGSKVTISGLKAGTMYCFQTARSNGINRSQRYCHPTMKRANRKKATKIGVATFNVCSKAGGCRSWRSRENAVVARIAEAKVDVVNIQESSGVVDRLTARFAPLGFSLASQYGSEAVYYRRSKLDLATVARTETVCLTTIVRPVEDTTDWLTDGGQHIDSAGVTWYYDFSAQEWYREVETCSPVTTQVADAGGYALGGSATAAWAHLLVKKTGKKYLFVSAHLANGKSQRDAKQRSNQTRRLAAKAQATAARSTIVFGGDFNSHRSRDHDTPRIQLAAVGFHDTYDSSARFGNAFINSYNGYQKRPVRGVKYGDHVDHIFVDARTGADNWAVVAPVRNGKNVVPIASDHNLVRVTVLLP